MKKIAGYLIAIFCGLFLITCSSDDERIIYSRNFFEINGYQYPLDRVEVNYLETDLLGQDIFDIALGNNRMLYTDSFVNTFVRLQLAKPGFYYEPEGRYLSHNVANTYFASLPEFAFDAHLIDNKVVSSLDYEDNFNVLDLKIVYLGNSIYQIDGYLQSPNNLQIYINYTGIINDYSFDNGTPLAKIKNYNSIQRLNKNNYKRK